MKENSVALKILWFAQVIISIRVLLFSIPVLINKIFTQSLSPNRVDDWFMMVVTLTSVLFLCAGILSITGHRLWKLCQYAVCAVTLALGFIFICFVKKHQLMMLGMYYSPVVFSAVMAVLITVIKSEPQVAGS